VIVGMPWRDRIALALAIVLNRPWAWLTLGGAYRAQPGINRAQRRALAKVRR